MKKVVEFPDSSAIKEEAAEWLVRLDSDKPLPAEQHRDLSAWMARSQAHREQLLSLAELWEKMNVLTELAAPIGNYRDELLSDELPNTARGARAAWRPLWAGAIVIMLCAGLILAGLKWSVFDSSTSSNGLYATAIGDQQSVTLSDGSVVLLNTDSQMRVDFDEYFRDIHLIKGEAHFTVSKDAERRFRVFAGPGLIEAVGTAFSVYLKEQTVDVTVTEGRVALASETPGAAVAASAGNSTLSAARSTPRMTTLGELKAGQVATIETAVQDPQLPGEILSNLKDVTRRDLSRRVAWTNGTLVFSGKTLAEAVREISRYTPVKIEFSDPAVGAITVGGVFPVGETELMFEALETTFGVDVTYLSETRVLVSAADSN